jgi:5-methylcytosine-specific restriction protein B
MGKPVMHQNLFSWVPFYEELADRLLLWQERQAELLNLIAQLRTAGHFLPELEDQGADGSHFPLREIDPFTIFALFNRGLKDDNRRRLATAHRAIERCAVLSRTIPLSG